LKGLDSPCIDTGNPTSVVDISVDIDGQPRFWDLSVGTPGVDLDRGGDELILFQFIRGDANADGVVSLGDAITILNYALGHGTLLNCDDAGDANDDGTVNLADFYYLWNALFVPGSPPPPPPYPDCGYDPTGDGKRCEEDLNDCQ
ncbi:MAG: dockerin type I domain-containing protein, partial [Planctomycetota bacterium]